MAYRLRYKAHDFELPPGAFVIGRGVDCQLAVDDPLTSRRHAVLHVGESSVVLEDLASRNGVTVNGVRIEGAVRLSNGDRVGIGSQELVLEESTSTLPPSAGRYRRPTETLEIDANVVAARVPSSRTPSRPQPAMRVGMIEEPPTDEPTVIGGRRLPGAPGESSRSVQSLNLLGSVAEKALALGRAEEAERLLGAMLTGILARARTKPGDVEPAMAEGAAKFGLRLATASGKATWLAYVFDLYTALGRLLPAPMVDELYTVVRRVKGVEARNLRNYLAALRAQAAAFGPSERFLLQRIEGLERLVALQ
jgi:hypothetical protein